MDKRQINMLERIFNIIGVAPKIQLDEGIIYIGNLSIRVEDVEISTIKGKATRPQYILEIALTEYNYPNVPDNVWVNEIYHSQNFIEVAIRLLKEYVGQMAIRELDRMVDDEFALQLEQEREMGL